MLLLTLRGTPTIYYGDEIAMTHAAIMPGQVVDPLERNVPGRGLGRDGCRTPMRWDSTVHAGFTTGEPWLPLVRASDKNDVANQRCDRTSMHQLYRRLIDLRRKREALLLGLYGRVLADRNLLVFTRELKDERILVALNFGGKPITTKLAPDEAAGRLLLSTAGDREDESVRGTIELRAHEGIIMKVQPLR
jgi:alpha-glucosidase